MNDQQQSRADALTDEHIATLKLAARAVTPQDIDGAERIESRPDGSYITCPACEGEGCIPFESDYCNYDHVAIGVQFYGVGTEPGAAEAYFRAAKPATILALLDRLERAESALAAPPVEQPAAAPADGACKRCGSTTAQACNDAGCFYLESGDGEPSAAQADERAVSFEAWCDRFPEISAVERLRDAWQEARAAASPAAMTSDMPTPVWWINYGNHGQISTRADEADRARESGAKVYEYRAASPAAKAVAWVRKHPDTGELSGDWLWNDAIEQCRKDSGVWFPLGFLGARPALPEEPAAIHQVIHQVWVEETSSWADVTPAYYAERQPSNRRRVYYAPQPAQAASPAAEGETEDHECVYENGDGVCRQCAELAKHHRAAASPAAERVTAALQALSADVHTLGDGWANDEAMIGLAKKYLRVEPKPASPELSLWRDFVLLAVTDAAPQPAQADAPAHAAECPHCDGEGVIEGDSGTSPCACQRDAQEGMPTFGARRAQADAPAEARERDDPELIAASNKGYAAGLRDGKALGACGPLAPADAGEAAAWRYRTSGDNWCYCDGDPVHVCDRDYEKQPLYTAPPAARVASLTNSQREAIEFAAKTMEARMLNAHACVLRALLNGADKS